MIDAVLARVSCSRRPASASLPASQPLLEAVKRQLGVVPNMFRIIGNSPAGLEGYLAPMGALGKGELGAKTRTRIPMVVAEMNGCDYCLSAHTYLGKERSQARRPRAHDPVRADQRPAYPRSE